MKRTHQFAKAILFVCVLFLGKSAFAGPPGCALGYQDNTCLTALSHGTIAPPTCPTSAGWTTVGSARWIGSGYTSPSCNYTAPPTCPPGYNESSVPSWNGSNWVGLGCTPIAVNIPAATLMANCEARMPAGSTPLAYMPGPNMWTPPVTWLTQGWGGFNDPGTPVPYPTRPDAYDAFAVLYKPPGGRNYVPSVVGGPNTAFVQMFWTEPDPYFGVYPYFAECGVDTQSGAVVWWMMMPDDMGGNSA